MSTSYRIVPDDLGEGSRRDRSCPVSFIVPAFQAAQTLPASIASIRACAPPGAEIIVVDDGSLDGTLGLARALADQAIARPCQGGAARARNDGARIARGAVLFFVDADVTVAPAAVRGALAHLERGAAAVFGAYTVLPPPGLRNVATVYKNLLHHYTHLHGAGDAKTFWSGFGAVRREAFFAVRGFDPAVTTGADVEDIHLGYRLRAAGYRIVLDPSLQVEHHKRYTIRRIVAADVFHRAVPWTRAMLQLRTFSSDLNLRAQSIVAGLVSLAIPLVLGSALWLGTAALAAASALVLAWLLLHARFLTYVTTHWGPSGAVASAGLLFLYYLYGIAGTMLGAFAYFLRHDRRSVLNRLRVETEAEVRDGVELTVAVVADPGEHFTALATLPRVEPWWELVVVAADPPPVLPEGARFLCAQPGTTRNAMRQLALEQARGSMLAILDADCVPEPGWFERVRAAVDTATLMVAGSFHDDRRSLRRRAEQVVRYWQWRPERPASWTVDHPANNAAFRTDVARKLGGFAVDGGLPVRLASFGARPVRFDPAMGVMLRTDRTARSFIRGIAGVARLRAATTVRYFDISRPHRLVLIAYVPIGEVLTIARIVRGALRDGLADRSFFLSLPLTSVALAASAFGRVAGLMFPDRYLGPVPASVQELGTVRREATVHSR